ncbi:MAG: hypothetical protein OXC25_09355, partial [Thiotrichales bacterium]|nr:hypothetical protein [Thiotrichales bacterium]
SIVSISSMLSEVSLIGIPSTPTSRVCTERAGVELNNNGQKKESKSARQSSPLSIPSSGLVAQLLLPLVTSGGTPPLN